MIERVRSTALSADGTPIACVRSGHGSPVVLVHGGGVDGSSLALVARGLAARRTVWVMHRRGRAHPIAPETYAIEREYEDVVAVAEQADEPVALFAHSYGALCALGALARRPELFTSAILYEPPIPTPGHPYATEDVVSRVDDLLAHDDPEAALLLFLREVVKLDEREIAASREASRAWRAIVAMAHVARWEARAVARYRLDPDAAAGITVPTTVLIGTDSHPQYRASAEALRAVLRPAPPLRWLDGQGHLGTAFAADAIVAVVEEAAR